MSASQETNISSFLIRFIDAAQSNHEAKSTYRGLIRHIQSGDEVSFTRWAEATDFIQRFFPLKDVDPRPPTDSSGITQD
jgi:hypothetical protein